MARIHVILFFCLFALVQNQSSAATLEWVDLINKGDNELSQGCRENANGYYDLALQLIDKSGVKDQSLLDALNMLKDRYPVGNCVERVQILQRLVFVQEKMFGPTNSGVAQSLTSLAESYWTLGRCREAEKLLKRAIVIFKNASMTEESANTINSLAYYKEKRKPREAVELYKQVLEIRTNQHDDFQIAVTEMHLASLYARLGFCRQAEALLKSALQLAEKHKHMLAAHDDFKIQHRLANIYLQQGKYVDAEQMYKDLIAKYQDQESRSIDVDHLWFIDGMTVPYNPPFVQTMWDYACLLKKQKRIKDALQLRDKALSMGVTSEEWKEGRWWWQDVETMFNNGY